MEHFIQVLDYIVGLFIVASLLVPGPNEVKRLAPIMLVIFLSIKLLAKYPQAKQALLAIISGI